MTQEVNENERYERAAQEWNERIGTAKSQAHNWRLACLISLLVSILLLLALIVTLQRDKTYVYVAEVKPGQHIANLQTLPQTVTVTDAQRLFFLARFVKQIMTVPLDPVVLRENWLSAYDQVSGLAITQLTTFAREEKPFAKVGQFTQTVHIQNFHPIGQHTYEMTWTVNQYNMQGQLSQAKVYNGSFTLSQDAQALSGGLNSLIHNPFGLKVVYLNILSEG